MRAYFDHNATTPVAPEVLTAMLPFLGAECGNASSIHTPGQRARTAVEEARESVAALIGVQPAEIVFTSGGTESDNLAIFGAGPLRNCTSSPRKSSITPSFILVRNFNARALRSLFYLSPPTLLLTLTTFAVRFVLKPCS